MYTNPNNMIANVKITDALIVNKINVIISYTLATSLQGQRIESQ